MLAIIRSSIQDICSDLKNRNLDYSDKRTEGSQSTDLLKLLQLLEKYVALQEKIMLAGQQEKEEAQIDYRLLKSYLDKKLNHAE